MNIEFPYSGSQEINGLDCYFSCSSSTDKALFLFPGDILSPSDYKPFLKELLERGISCIIINYYAGSLMANGSREIHKEISDRALGVLGELRRKLSLKDSHIIYYGHSRGGLILANLIKHLPTASKVFLDAPILNYKFRKSTVTPRFLIDCIPLLFFWRARISIEMIAERLFSNSLSKAEARRRFPGNRFIYKKVIKDNFPVDLKGTSEYDMTVFMHQKDKAISNSALLANLELIKKECETDMKCFHLGENHCTLITNPKVVVDIINKAN